MKLKKTNDGLVPRAFSHSISGSTSAFKEAVRERDEGCAIFNAVNKLKRDGEWKAFEAAHIFPLERGSDFAAMGGDRWITDCDGESVAAKLNSPQNGMILHSSIDKHFDSFTVGIDVDVSLTTFNFVVWANVFARMGIRWFFSGKAILWWKAAMETLWQSGLGRMEMSVLEMSFSDGI